MRRAVLVVLAFGMGAGAAKAEVTDRSPAGFQSQHVVEVAAPRDKVWAALLRPALWWNSSHSWSGSAKNLSIDLAQRCFCETLKDGGFVRHLEVVYSDSASTLRLAGALGPLVTTGATGHLQVGLKDAGAGRTTLTLTYDVGGYAQGRPRRGVGRARRWRAGRAGRPAQASGRDGKVRLGRSRRPDLPAA